MKDLTLVLGQCLRWLQQNHKIGVGGVGKKSQQTDQGVIMLIAPSGTTSTYTDTASVLPDSSAPALVGFLSLEGLNAVLDTCKHQRKLYVGDEDCVHVIPHESTDIHDLKKAQSGHLMLPVSNFRGATTKSSRAYSKHVEGKRTGKHIHFVPMLAHDKFRVRLCTGTHL